MDPDRIVELLGLEPHPEGGRYRETWVGSDRGDGRAVGTAIYFLLRAGEVSQWHRVDAAETWHHYAGASLSLSTSWGDGDPVRRRLLGVDLEAGERPQLVVAAHEWQSARSLGAWTLVGCTVAPGFEFAHFEMAPSGWSPDADG